MERLTYEHVKLFGVFVDSPTFLVEIRNESEKLGVFGFYVMARRELEDAVLFRATHLMKCSMVDPVLNQVTAHVSCNLGEIVFTYDEDEFGFRELC